MQTYITLILILMSYRCSQREPEGTGSYPKSRGLLSVAITDEISPINEKEQNCCSNEIIVNNQLNEDHSKLSIQKQNHGSLHSRKKNRDTSAKLR